MISKEPVIIVRTSSGGFYADGRAKPGVTERLVVEGVTVAPRETERVINGVISYSYENTYNLFFPPGTEILTDDWFEFRGMACYKDGSATDWGYVPSVFNPAGIVVPVKIVIGGSARG